MREGRAVFHRADTPSLSFVVGRATGKTAGNLTGTARFAPKCPAILPHDLSMGGSGCHHGQDGTSSSTTLRKWSGPCCVDRSNEPVRKCNRRASRGNPPIKSLAAQAELFDQRRIAAFVLALEVIKETAALRNECQKTTAGMVVLLVVLEVLGQVLDAFGKNSHLDFRRSGITLGGCKFSHQRLF